MNQPTDTSDNQLADTDVSQDVQGDGGQEEPQRRRSRVLEVLVSLSIVVSLAGVTVPIIASVQAEARLESTVVGMQDIVDGIRGYSQDTLFLPTGNRGRTNVSWLYSEGALPQGIRFGGVVESRPLADVLLNRSMGGPGWEGPYGEVPSDPWGNAYLVNVAGLVDSRSGSWVLSAGPDGIIQTSQDSLKAGGDDLLLPIN